MKILLTGAHGFLGHHTALLLASRGHDVTGTDRAASSAQKNERRKRLGDAIRFEAQDLDVYRSALALIRKVRPDVVVHLAGQFPIHHCAESNAAYVASNVTSWLNVVEAARIVGVERIVYASSVVALARSSSIYGASKMFGENAAFAYSLLGMHMIGLRFGAVYGPAVRRESSIYRLATQLLAGKEIVKSKGITSPMHMIEVSDAAEVTARCAVSLLRGHNIFLVAADDEKASLGDIAVELAPHLGVRPHFPDGYVPTPRSGRPDLSPIQEAIGFTPQITLRRGVARFAEWMKTA